MLSETLQLITQVATLVFVVGGMAAMALGLTVSRMEKLVDLYRKLRKTLLSKYSGDGV